MQTEVVSYQSDGIYGIAAVLDDISTFIRPLSSQHRMINDLSNEFEVYKSMPRIEDLTTTLQDMPSGGKKPGRRSNESNSSVESGSSSASSTGSSCWERRCLAEKNFESLLQSARVRALCLNLRPEDRCLSNTGYRKGRPECLTLLSFEEYLLRNEVVSDSCVSRCYSMLMEKAKIDRNISIGLATKLKRAGKLSIHGVLEWFEFRVFPQLDGYSDILNDLLGRCTSEDSYYSHSQRWKAALQANQILRKTLCCSRSEDLSGFPLLSPEHVPNIAAGLLMNWELKHAGPYEKTFDRFHPLWKLKKEERSLIYGVSKRFLGLNTRYAAELSLFPLKYDELVVLI